AEYDAAATTDDGSCATLIDPCENALVLGSIEVDLSTTTLTAADGSATLTVTTGTPTSLTLTGINGAPDYTIAQPGAIDGLATGYYTVTATDANGCTSNSLQLVIPYSLCCDCGVYDTDTDGICDDTDNCTDRDAANYNDPANGTCIFYGCTNPAAVNYDASANTDDGSCIIYGCTDPAYTQYNPAANTDDGSCTTLIVEGCTDPAAANYNAAANTDDGSCLYPGCMDPAYMEYDASANTDDGSCSTLIVEGCTDSAADNYDPAANVDDGSCLYYGCTDPAYMEYDATANTDDGSCSTLIVEGCTDPAADNYNPAANTDDGSCIISGCMDPAADNYNAAANTDDGSCVISGCTDPAFEEYNPDATTDDGSCYWPSYCQSVDMDGITYDAVEIDEQCWFTFNLRTTVYADGTPIPYVGWEPVDQSDQSISNEGTAGDLEWANDTEGGRSIYLHNNVNSDGDWEGASYQDPDWNCPNYADSNLPPFCCVMCAYGQQYNFHAVTNPSGLCPTGWHVPTDADWTQLTDYVASQGYAGNEGTALKGTGSAHWFNGVQIATDAFGLAITGMNSRKTDGQFYPYSTTAKFGMYWSSTPTLNSAGDPSGWARIFKYDWAHILRVPQDDNMGHYVRCIKDPHVGCTDPNYLEYNPFAPNDDGSCTTLVVEGCMDPAAPNYDPAANTEDGSCIYYGCTDPTFMEYDPAANTDDGSCSTLIVEGCMDPAASNYDASANVDDGSCLYPGCTDPDYLEYDPDANIDDGSCSVLIIPGCTDPDYAEYDATATLDDGSCECLIVDPACVSPTMDGHSYDVVQIGCQCWFAENLRTTVYEDGTSIPTDLTESEYASTTSGASFVVGQSNMHDVIGGQDSIYCSLYDCYICGSAPYCADSSLYIEDYGRLYNWHATRDVRGVCPSGWHVPHNNEWDELLDYLVTQGYPRDVYNSSGFLVEEGNNGLPMMTTSGWFTNNGTDEFGFAAKPAGYIWNAAGENQYNVTQIGQTARWWSSSIPNSSTGYLYPGYEIHDLSGGQNGNVRLSERLSSGPDVGYSIRCIKD
ncbi:MAG: FISUMP domain-containing protein, partial [Flavobacteriales bacterium]